MSVDGVVESEGNHSHQTSRQEDDRIDQTHNPLIPPSATVDTEFLWERQVGAVGSSLVPSLRSGSNGTQRDGVPEHGGAMPFVVSLVYERVAFGLVKLLQSFEAAWVTCDEGSPAEQSFMFGHAMRLGVHLGIGDALCVGAALCVAPSLAQDARQTIRICGCWTYRQRILDDVHSYRSPTTSSLRLVVLGRWSAIIHLVEGDAFRRWVHLLRHSDSR